MCHERVAAARVTLIVLASMFLASHAVSGAKEKEAGRTSSR